VPGQTVDATPSDMKLFSKVVFMKQGRRAAWLDEQFGKRRNQEEKEKMKEKV
jgi:hypothetical protein